MSVQALSWALEHETTTTGSERLVLLSLANHASDDAWECWPSIERIMREANIKRRQTVKDALASLVAKGIIDREVNGAPDGRLALDRRPNLYRILASNGGTQTEPPSEREPGARGHAKRANGGTQTEPLTVREPSEEPSNPTTPVRADEFEAFWQAYPRRVSKGNALKAWMRARKTTDAETIMAGVAQYVEEVRGKEAQYVAHPASWLNAQRWLDEPAPAAGRKTRAPKIDNDRSAPSGEYDPWEGIE